ncbi:single-strand DNA-binding protein [Anaerospora hongkongensis]|uniref:Single-stranded DNA-binding protein n=1 Tax=Anaerospora hongkongensis TaxID=244830 RepID=A0A4R1Q1Z9_9FIRM|nr:single-stranded DNA-binding protein [Anaerospora hongkongensis]TCL39999.1 single-strand DNA-binding protein [Anaerospora hongkongensis]
MNSVKLIGRLAQDPEVRYTKTGKAVCSFTIAVSRSFGAPGQEQRESTDFIPIVAWGNLAEMCGNNLAKGHRVFVEGRLQVRSYETTDGQKRRVTEIVANFVAQSMESSNSNSSSSSSKPVDFGQFGRDVIDEEIPF